MNQLLNDSLPVVFDDLVWADPEVGQINQIELFSSLSLLQGATEKALVNLEPGRSGPKKSREGLQLFILSMGRIYSELTGRTPTAPAHDVDKGYYGPFFNFIANSLKLINMGLSNAPTPNLRPRIGSF